jgi:hypothetical protein
MEEQAARILAILNKTYPLKLFTDAQKGAIAASASIVSFEEGAPIYQIDQEANHLFVVLAGQVRLTWPVDEDDPEAGEIPLGDLDEAEVIGLEALEEESTYRTNGVAVTRVQVIRLDMEFLDPFFEENAIPYDELLLLLNSLKLFLRMDLPWRNPEEAVIFIARRHTAFLFYRLLAPVALFAIGILILLVLIITRIPGTTLIGAIAGGVALLAGLWSIWNYLDWTNDYSILTTQRAVYQERVIALYDSRLETPLDSILATSLDTSQVGRILGFGDVIMKTYTGTLLFPDLAHRETVRLMIDDRRARAREASMQLEKQTIQTMVRQRLRMVPPAQSGPGKSVSPEEHPISLGERLAYFFQMRSENAGVITYRTHWFILMRKALPPLLVLLGLVVLALLRIFGVVVFLNDLGFWPVYLVVLLIVGFWQWYQYEDWANDKYIVSDEQIIDVYKKPIGQEEKRIAPLKSIQSVEFERLGIIGLVLNYGTVYIRIGDTRFTFDNVYNPSEVQRDLFRRIATQADKERRKSIDTDRQRILDVLEAYHEVTRQPPQPGAPPPIVPGTNS